MPAFSQVRWSQFVGLCGLVLLAEGLSRGVNGLLRIVRNEAYLRGSDAVILLDKKTWADITGHRVPAAAGMAQAIIPRGTATTRRRGHGGRRLFSTRATWTAPRRTRRVHLGTPRGSAGARQRLGRQRLRAYRGHRP